MSGAGRRIASGATWHGPLIGRSQNRKLTTKTPRTPRKETANQASSGPWCLGGRPVLAAGDCTPALRAEISALRPTVDHAPGLADRALDLADRHDLDDGADAYPGFDVVLQARGDPFDRLGAVGCRFGAELGKNLEFV